MLTGCCCPTSSCFPSSFSPSCLLSKHGGAWGRVSSQTWNMSERGRAALTANLLISGTLAPIFSCYVSTSSRSSRLARLVASWGQEVLRWLETMATRRHGGSAGNIYCQTLPSSGRASALQPFHWQRGPGRGPGPGPGGGGGTRRGTRRGTRTWTRRGTIIILYYFFIYDLIFLCEYFDAICRQTGEWQLFIFTKGANNSSIVHV